jgi:hypothetical protein
MIRLLPPRPLLLAVVPLLLLGACGKSSAPQASSTASGEILPGTVSDAMLDTDRSQAEAPLTPAVHSAAAKVDMVASADASAAATDAAAANAAAPADSYLAGPKPQSSSTPATP